MLSENEQLNLPTVCQDVNVDVILIIDNEQLNQLNVKVSIPMSF